MHVSPLYKALWVWKDRQLSYISANVKEKSGTKLTTKSRPSVEFVGSKSIKFLDNVDQNQQKLFKLKYQRVIRHGMPNIITLQDIKDVVTFLLIGNLPKNVIRLIHSYEINYLIRALILYMQLYLQIHDDLRYRNASYAAQRLKHPICTVRETLCKTHLNKLRIRIGQEYGLLIAGEGYYKRYHHMNNPLNQSYMTKDVELNEYMSKLFARIVWVALYRSNYKEIEMEICRLFHFKSIDRDKMRNSWSTTQCESVKQVLRGDPVTFVSHLHRLSPVISNIFTSGRSTDLLLSKNLDLTRIVETEVTGLEVALMLPEELLVKFNFTVGILGLPRDDFESMLHAKQHHPKNILEEQALDTNAMLAEKPMVKMYEYIGQLEKRVYLNKIVVKEDTEDLKEEINRYLSNHVNDGIKSYKMWKVNKYEPTI